MSGENDRLLYVGKAANLRQRLNSYKNAQAGRASRKVIRLVHQVRAITWEICDSPEAALLRENQLLRLHKPKFNVLNTRPEHYRFIRLLADGPTLHLRLDRDSSSVEGELVFGAFKALGRVRAACDSLFRLLWIAEHRPASFYDLPIFFIGEKPVENHSLSFGGGDTRGWFDSLRDFLAGSNTAMLDGLEKNLLEGRDPAWPLSGLVRNDLEILRLFFQFGPARNRRLRDRCGLDSVLIQQAELDDLLVLERPQKQPE
jgi:excinuclease UvrABC nuclease subunit